MSSCVTKHSSSLITYQQPPNRSVRVVSAVTGRWSNSWALRSLHKLQAGKRWMNRWEKLHERCSKILRINGLCTCFFWIYRRLWDIVSLWMNVCIYIYKLARTMSSDAKCSWRMQRWRDFTWVRAVINSNHAQTVHMPLFGLLMTLSL